MPLEEDFRFRCTARFKARIKIAAKKNGRSMSNFVIYALEKFLEAEEARIIAQIGHAGYDVMLRDSEAEIANEGKPKAKQKRR